MVIRGGSCSVGLEFESHHRMDIFHIYLLYVKIVLQFENIENKKEAWRGIAHFLELYDGIVSQQN